MRRQSRYAYPIVSILLFGVGTASVAPFVLNPVHIPSVSRWVMFLFLAAGSSFVSLDMSYIRLSAAAVVQIAVMLHYGPAVLYPVTMVSLLPDLLFGNRDSWRFLANLGQLSLCSVVFFLAVGGLPNLRSASSIPPLFYGVVAFMAVNALGVALTSSTREHSPYFGNLLHVTGPLLRSYPVAFAAGYLAAYTYGFSLTAFIFILGGALLLMGLASRYMTLYANLRESYLRTVSTLSAIIEMRDPQTSGHSERVGHYAAMLGKRLRLPRERIDDLHVAGLFHDIGKMGVSEEILQKRRPLSASEFVKVKEHPVKGYDIAVKANLPEFVAQAIQHHHEWYDGSGYPQGLKGDEIPESARILAIADCFDAMTSERVYRTSFSVERALDEIVGGAGTQFDPRMIEAFIECLRHTNSEVNGGPDGAVSAQPVVQIGHASGQ